MMVRSAALAPWRAAVFIATPYVHIHMQTHIHLSLRSAPTFFEILMVPGNRGRRKTSSLDPYRENENCVDFFNETYA